MKLSIKKKMMVGFGVIIILMIVANAYILLELIALSQTARVTLTSHVRSIDFAKQLQTLLYEQERNAQKYFISHDKIYYDLFREGRKRFDEYIDSLSMVQSTTNGIPLINDLHRTHGWFISTVTLNDGRTGKRSKVEHTKHDQARSDSLEVLHNTLDNLIRLNQLAIDNSMANVESITERSTGVALGLTLCTLLAAIILAIIIPRTITKPIDALIRGTNQIARGIFEPISISSHDEIALLTDAVNTMSAKLKKINEIRADLTQQITHEFRNPLQIILAALYTLKKHHASTLNEEHFRLLDSIRECVGKLTNFTNQLLDIAKIEAGMMEYHLKPTDFLSIIKPIVEDAKLVASRKEITVALNSQPVPPIMADEEKISQVISNLFSNAIKYTNRGGTITAHVNEHGTTVRTAIEDSGVGIAPEDIPKVFTKFYQATNVGQASSKGTGLGLALVKSFTEGHGGKVLVTSTPGVGSTFTIELPIMQNSAQHTHA